MKTICTGLLAVLLFSTAAQAKVAPAKKKTVSLKMTLINADGKFHSQEEKAEAKKSTSKTADEPKTKAKASRKSATVNSKKSKVASKKTKPNRQATKRLPLARPISAHKPKAQPVAAAPVRPAVPAGFAPQTGIRQDSGSNIGHLINKAEGRQANLEKKVKAKTAEKEEPDDRVAHYDFEDVNVKWDRTPTAAEPKAQPARQAPQAGANMNLQLIPKK